MTERISITLLAILLAAGAGSACDRGGAPDGPPAPGTPAPTAQPTSEPQPAHPGSGPYELLCASCHGNDGTPTGAGRAVGAPSLRTARVAGLPAEDIMRLVHEGRGNMRPIDIEDAALADVIGYIRTFSQP
jgi:mono/diheme cytochrome c family protein